MLTDFQKNFTHGLSRDRLMNWSLKVHHTLKASIPTLWKVNVRKLPTRGILFQYTSEKRWTFIVLKDFSRFILLF